MTFAQRLSLLWRRFSPLEEQLVAAVRDVLPPAVLPIYDAQVSAVNHVQRLPGWSEIDLYRRRLGRVDWSGVPMFPRAGEFPLADVAFSANDRRYKATLTCIAGHIFDFAIVPAPRSAAFAAWDAPPAARLLSDPSASGATGPGEPIAERWLQFLARASAHDTTGWTLHDRNSAYRVAVDDAQFLVLAERAGGQFVLQRIEPGDPLFYLESHDATPQPIEGELDEVFRRTTTENR